LGNHFDDDNQKQITVQGSGRTIREQEIRVPQDHAPYAPPPAQPQPQIVYNVRKGRSGCSWMLMGVGGLLLLIGVAAVIWSISTGNSISNLTNGFVNGISGVLNSANQPPRAVVNSAPSVLVGIQQMGQLVSVQAQLAQADIEVNVTQGPLNACGFAANHVAQGTISAGIDLTQLTQDDIVFDAISNTYTITLPYPQLASCAVDYIRQYEGTTTVCTVDWDAARMLADYSALTSFRDQSLEGGILNRAANEARLVIGNFVQLVTGANVNVVFSPQAESIMPAQCQPSPPPGWEQDAGTGLWTRVG